MHWSYNANIFALLLCVSCNLWLYLGSEKVYFSFHIISKQAFHYQLQCVHYDFLETTCNVALNFQSCMKKKEANDAKKAQ